MWDLEQNKEVAILNKPSELFTFNNFVNTGFKLSWDILFIHN